MACELPAESGRPLTRWSAAEVAAEAVQRGIVCEINGPGGRARVISGEDAVDLSHAVPGFRVALTELFD